ncbi:hypothetical protein GH714_008182 [Hevea brasiliensis]|uniref:NAB domain-containing protein n=1 Tax=Hevea brasiliensis TaxID=3981 RepID=A0A6A6LZI6_HEVBR|nr:hypothetical protein GH714_008182 [Hevea brasiliensis]
MGQGVNLVLKMIEQDSASLAKKAELCKQTRPDLIDEIKEFYCLYRSLAERYDRLNAELYKSIPTEFQMNGVDNALDTPMLTPAQKIGLFKTDRVASVSCGVASNAYYNLPMNTDHHKGLHYKTLELGTALPSMEKKFKVDVEENGDEKDGLNAKVNTLTADLSSQDNQIGQMDEHLWRMQMEILELIARSEIVQKLVDPLRSRVVELEKEVDKQRGELSAGAEQKREAIRQLCFSLDHYRSGYKELCVAFIQQKRHAVMAS